VYHQVSYVKNIKRMKRRTFLAKTGVATAGILSAPTFIKAHVSSSWGFQSKRPPLAERKFTSKIIEDIIVSTKKIIKDPELAWMFENCFPNTLDTTVDYSEPNGKPDTFVITGDIHAMWLRDSTAQVWPYISYVAKDKALFNLILGVINRQSYCINIDPYANAFNKGKEGSEWEKDLTDMKPELHERKWEIDSLCYPVRLAYRFWKETGDTSFFSEDFNNALHLILRTFKEQQRKEGQGPYSFMRITEKATDTVPGKGFGYPVKPVGLICSTFRPSDDATVYSFLIPSNYFAVESLKQMAEMATEIKGKKDFAKECLNLKDEVQSALEKYAASDHLHFGKTLAFEVDGFGNQLFMDDANVPSLLALPYLGCIDPSDSLYKNTRNFVLSENNPWYFKGKAGAGIGGPHVGVDLIWPLSLIIQAMTSTDSDEIKNCIVTLKSTHAGTGFMHETFHKDDPAIFSRSWFAWANTLFGELILKVAKENPEILKSI
jgi:meiotically up-regulated gene 157 (Mug157) protein